MSLQDELIQDMSTSKKGRYRGAKSYNGIKLQAIHNDHSYDMNYDLYNNSLIDIDHMNFTEDAGQGNRESNSDNSKRVKRFKRRS